MPKKKLIALSVIIVALISGIILSKNIQKDDIETFNAIINIESTNVPANAGGTLKLINLTDNRQVKKGELIAEIETSVQQASAPKTKNTEQDYEKAAIMYKDGIITQEEYDKRINNIKNTSTPQENTNSVKITKVYAPVDGEIKLNNFKSGDNIREEEVFANILSSNKEIQAYFPVTYQKHIKNGKKVEINIVKYPEKLFSGTITKIEKPDPHGLPVKILFNENTSALNLNNGDSAILKLVD